jgi:hypothetical protein
MQIGIRNAALRLGMLASAAVLMGREEVPTRVEACVACLENGSCVSASGGVLACSFKSGSCQPAGGICS